MLQELHLYELAGQHFPHAWCVSDTTVLDKYRLQGIGSAILEHAKKIADNNKVPLLLEADSGTVDFFMRNGFEPPRIKIPPSPFLIYNETGNIKGITLHVRSHLNRDEQLY